MKLNHRPMQPEDFRECVEFLANQPVLAARYGPAIGHLGEVWLGLLRCGAFNSAVVRAGEGSSDPICLFGVTAIVRDDFLLEMKTPPHFWMGPEITRRIMRGESPLLTDKQLREANSGGGLNLACWEAGFRPGYEAHGEVQRYFMSSFIQIHQGYLWKEVISSQPERADRLDFILKTGGCLWDSLAGRYTSTVTKDLSEMVSQPHVVGITRDLELKRQGDWSGSWVGALFDYHPPVLGFSRSEQRLLSSALPGGTDEHLAEMLGTSLPAVKKMWVSIYCRVEDHLPELIGDPLQSEVPPSGRGKEKRRRLLAYLREHPEELRPVSRKLLAKTGMRAGALERANHR
jgi:hypothetical protein